MQSTHISSPIFTLLRSHKEVALCGQVGSKEFRDVGGWDAMGLVGRGGWLAGYIEFRPQAKKERNRLKGQRALTLQPIPPPKF